VKEWINEHMKLVLKNKGFLSGRVYKSTPLFTDVDPSKAYYRNIYEVDNRENLDTFLQEALANMRKQSNQKFGSKASTTRFCLEHEVFAEKETSEK
jgi:hypothetical protein